MRKNRRKQTAFTAAVLAFGLAGCGVEQQTNEVNGSGADSDNQATNMSVAETSKESAAQSDANGVTQAEALNGFEAPPGDRPVPKLGNVTIADIQSQLEPGAGCELRSGKQRLLVAAGKNAIARPANKLVTMWFEGGDLWKGGTFRLRDLSIRVSPAQSRGTTVDEETTRPATAVVNAAGREEKLSGQWACGA